MDALFYVSGCSRQCVVTAKSRRIVPTPVSFVGQSDDPSTSFLKVVDVPAPAKVMPRSIWAKPPENISGLVQVFVVITMHISSITTRGVVAQW